MYPIDDADTETATSIPSATLLRNCSCKVDSRV